MWNIDRKHPANKDLVEAERFNNAKRNVHIFAPVALSRLPEGCAVDGVVWNKPIDHIDYSMFTAGYPRITTSDFWADEVNVDAALTMANQIVEQYSRRGVEFDFRTPSMHRANDAEGRPLFPNRVEEPEIAIDWLRKRFGGRS